MKKVLSDSLDQKTGVTPEDRKFIKDFVSSFLEDYIRGRITRETDAKDRKSMIQELIEQMPGFNSQG
jgi:hypothetical protein